MQNPFGLIVADFCSLALPWVLQYKESLDLFEHPSHHVNASTVRASPLFVSAKGQATADATTSSSSSTRLRGQANGNEVDVYRNDKGNKQVDVYRHHDPEGTSAAGSKGTSYMFCPQAYGMMSGDMSRVYWSRVQQQAGEQEGQAPGTKEIRYVWHASSLHGETLLNSFNIRLGRVISNCRAFPWYAGLRLSARLPPLSCRLRPLVPPRPQRLARTNPCPHQTVPLRLNTR